MKKHLKEKEKKAGSALLVVLGFLSFMVVSAVAFAIYMRAERLPSSALRRNVATRHLVKAALAHAMSRVDDAIRNDPFPGVANAKSISNCYRDRNDNAMDVWYGRVFMPPNPDGLQDDSESDVLAANDPSDLGKFAWRFAPATETVSVLNLEALGYVPPPLVNDVRFLSRSTWTAKWQNFDYDAGRFAFCAVNVSDYLDVNRTKLSVGRSSPLDSCISLRGTIAATKKDDGSYDMETVSDGDFTRLAQIFGPDATGRQSYSNPDGTSGSSAGGTVPYVSMLDYNLALGNDTYGGSLLRSLFYPWIKNEGNGYFYGGTVLSSLGIQQAMRQPFVTDSFFATSNTAYEIDYAKLDGQPFKDVDMKDGNRLTMSDMVIRNSDRFLKRMYDKGLLGEWDMPVFYDYLDHDDVPFSLAMPGVECVPMIAAVELVGNNLAQLKVNPPAAPVPQYNPNAPGPTVQTTTMTYELDPSSFDSGVAGLRVLVAFPFRHFAGRNLNGFNVQVAMKVFVASEGAGGTGMVSVRPENDLQNIRPQNKAEWALPCKEFTIDGRAPGDALAWSLYSNRVNVSIPNECRTQEDAVMQIDVTSWNGSARVPAGQPFFSAITEQPGTMSATGVFTPSGPATYSHQFNLRPFKDGTLLPAGKLPGDIGDTTAVSYGADKFKVYAMVWVRITDSSGNETYDLAPAVVADDELNNKIGANHADVYEALRFGAKVDASNPSSPCLRFSDQTKTYTYNTFSAMAAVPPAAPYPGLDGTSRTWTPNALATVDPRYNYMPEDWFEWNQSGIDGGKWLDTIQDPAYKFFGVANNRDSDIFMFTSNQGYLQSLGEFSFLPRLSEWPSTPGRCSMLLVENTPRADPNARHAASPSDIRNNACAWRTYPVDREFYEDCALYGIGRDSGKVQTVNPFSDNGNILLAAFANTPCDYWTTGRTVAGAKDNDLDDDLAAIVSKMGDKSETSGDAIKTASQAVKHAFCKENEDSSSKMDPKEICAIMQQVTSFFRSAGDENQGNESTTWEDRYDALPWFSDLDPQRDDTFKTFMGTSLGNCPLYSIDRKFLYSYWRECFANKQQLFLIFVRAESTALGGPGEGTPAQQGGRAVALVWREPVAYDDGSNPSNTHPDNDTSWGGKYNWDSSRERRPHRMRVLFYHQFD